MLELPLLVLATTQLVTLLGGVALYRSLKRDVEQAHRSQIEDSLRQSVTELLAELEASTERAAQGISRQRESLVRLLRDADRRIQLLPDEGPAEDAGEMEPVVSSVARQARRAAGWQEVAVRLAGDGLSEAAIARRLKVGLEEVRLTLALHMPGPA
jgi:hypothetical protein